MVNGFAVRIRGLGWRALPLGLLTLMAGAGGLVALFALKNFSSQVRDQFEAAPGAGSYVALMGAMLVLVGVCAAGLYLSWAGVDAVRRGRRNGQ